VKMAAVKKAPAKAAVKKAPVKKAVAKRAPAKAAVKKAVAKKAPAKATRKGKKNVSGYGGGSVNVVMSVDQVAREAASIAANAPTVPELEKLANKDNYLSINNLRAGYGKMEILGRTVLVNQLCFIRSLALPIFFPDQLLLMEKM
jgi:branched-chain amino acid transport system ATP-binding protein